jgi:hypothetical protein
MRRSDKLHFQNPVLGRLTVMVVTLLLTTAPMTVLGQTKAPAKAPQSAPKRTAPAQAKKPAAHKSEPEMEWLQETLKDPELMKSVGHMTERLTNELQYPAPRTQSHILPRLSDSTMLYAAFPNYGQVLRQSLQIWQQELNGSAALKNFLQKNKLDASEPKFEDTVQKIADFTDYLGDEMVFAASMKGKKPSGVLVAEVRKPGLKEFLGKIDQLLNTDASKEHLRIFDPQQLQTATDAPNSGLTVLVRPDFMVIGGSAATVREFNAQLDQGAASFASSSLGKRLGQAYQAGTNSVLAADLQRLMGLIPQGSPQAMQATMMLEKTGFGDAKYALVESRGTGKNSTNHMELVFNGPRHGVASWIAAPAALGALDFMSPKSSIAEAFRLKSPAQMFDDIVEIAGPMAFQMLPQIEQQFNVNLKQDILSKLGGEIGFEMQTPPQVAAPAQGMAAAQPNFKVMLSVTDANGLQQTLKRLMAQSPVQPEEHVEDGVTFYSMAMPSASGAGPEFNYFFLDGYLIVTTNRELAREAMNLHRTGGSLARAQGQPVKASAFVYQNTGPFLAAMVRQLPPDVAGLLPKIFSDDQPQANMFYAYADDTSIRATTSNNTTMNASFVLIGAAIAIPNLLRSKMTANEEAAVSTLRVINISEVTYSTEYPKKGYAPSLAVLGPGPNSNCTDGTAAHACLLDEKLADPSCTAGKWCIKSGYKFTVRSTCTTAGICSSYVATATPVTAGSTGANSYCSTTDAVIRKQKGPVDTPLTMAQCKAWKPAY